jgi:hypothetical protein
MVGMECAKNLVLLVWEAICQPDLEGTVNLVDILWPCLVEGLSPRLRASSMSRTTSSASFALAFDFLGVLLSASLPPAEDGAEAFFLTALHFLAPISAFRANLAEFIYAQHPIISSLDSGNSPSSKTIPTAFALSPQITSLHLSHGRRTTM